MVRRLVIILAIAGAALTAGAAMAASPSISASASARGADFAVRFSETGLTPGTFDVVEANFRETTVAQCTSPKGRTSRIVVLDHRLTGDEVSGTVAPDGTFSGVIHVPFWATLLDGFTYPCPNGRPSVFLLDREDSLVVSDPFSGASVAVPGTFKHDYLG
jgi:hypothetical protein